MKAFILGLVCALLCILAGLAGQYVGFALAAGLYVAATIVGMVALMCYLHNGG